MPNRKKIIEEIVAGLHAIGNKMQAKIMAERCKDRVTHSQWFVLSVIEQHHDISVKEISKILNISSSAITQLIDGLVENGYVARKADSNDRRVLRLNLATSGKKRIAVMQKKHTKKTAVLFSALNNKELEDYLRLHKKIVSHIIKTNNHQY